jgi:DHA3 family multidrug efflux protein-like MFS transporter
MGACLIITIALTAVAGAHLATIHVDKDTSPHEEGEAAPEGSTKFDLSGALRAVRLVPGLLALLFFSTFNNFLGGVFMALMDPYGLELVSVESWGILLAVSSFGFIVGGVAVARRGLGTNPVRTLLLVNIVMWSITILFPIRSLVLPLAIGFFLYMVVIPVAEASEQTTIQRVVPYREQGRVFGFAQTVETAASPVTAFLIGPIAQAWVIPFMTDGAGAETIGSWFGSGPDRGMALIFIIAGSIGLLATLLAFQSRAYEDISRSYAGTRPEPAPTRAPED